MKDMKVDNSGNGNCMYYAYSISLMYALRNKNDRDMTQRIFSKFDLADQQLERLNTILTTESQQEYTQEQCNEIEKILGPATRKLAADATIAQYYSDEKSTELFASANYGIEYYFKLELKKKHPEIAKLINNNYDNDELKQAEFYRLPHIAQEMETFCKKQAQSLCQQVKIKNENPLITDSSENILHQCIQDKTLEFFQKNSSEVLINYYNRINKDRVWGTTDILNTLHNCILGEEVVKDPETQQVLKFTYLNPLKLHISNNPFSNETTPDIILQNHHNTHWTSLIPHHIFPNSANDKKASSTTLFHSKYNEDLYTDNAKENKSPIGWQVLSGFMMVVGIAAVAMAYTALNIATLGVAGAATLTALGGITALSGLGIFAYKTAFDLADNLPEHISLTTE